MKKLLIILTLIVLLFPQSVHAQMMGTFDESSEEHQTLKEVLPQILDNYGVERVEDLDCGNVSDSDFEILGDAVMGEMHDGDTHEAMDDMMGGEGSSSLKEAHIRMGENYLGCNGYSGMGVMGSMMGGYGYGGMHGYGYGLNGLLWTIDSLLVGVLLVVLIRYFWIKTGGKK